MAETSGFPEHVRDQLLSKARFRGPTWYCDAEGDCIEFLISGDRFYGERIDNWVTAYYSYETGELVGSQIKGVRRLLDLVPGLSSIEVQEGKVRLSHLYRASGWSCTHSREEVATVYRQMIASAEKANAEVDLATC